MYGLLGSHLEDTPELLYRTEIPGSPLPDHAGFQGPEQASQQHSQDLEHQQKPLQKQRLCTAPLPLNDPGPSRGLLWEYTSSLEQDTNAPWVQALHQSYPEKAIPWGGRCAMPFRAQSSWIWATWEAHTLVTASSTPQNTRGHSIQQTLLVPHTSEQGAVTDRNCCSLTPPCTAKLERISDSFSHKAGSRTVLTPSCAT